MTTSNKLDKASSNESSISSSYSDRSLPEDLKQQLLAEHGPNKIVCSETFNEIWHVPFGRKNFSNAESFTNCINVTIKKKKSTDNWEIGNLLPKKSNEQDANLNTTLKNLATELTTKIKTLQPQLSEKSNIKSLKTTTPQSSAQRDQQPKKTEKFDFGQSLNLPTMMPNNSEPDIYRNKYHIVDNLTKVYTGKATQSEELSSPSTSSPRDNIPKKKIFTDLSTSHHAIQVKSKLSNDAVFEEKSENAISNKSPDTSNKTTTASEINSSTTASKFDYAKSRTRSSSSSNTQRYDLTKIWLSPPSILASKQVDSKHQNFEFPKQKEAALPSPKSPLLSPAPQKQLQPKQLQQQQPPSPVPQKQLQQKQQQQQQQLPQQYSPKPVPQKQPEQQPSSPKPVPQKQTEQQSSLSSHKPVEKKQTNQQQPPPLPLTSVPQKQPQSQQPTPLVPSIATKNQTSIYEQATTSVNKIESNIQIKPNLKQNNEATSHQEQHQSRINSSDQYQILKVVKDPLKKNTIESTIKTNLNLPPSKLRENSEFANQPASTSYGKPDTIPGRTLTKRENNRETSSDKKQQDSHRKENHNRSEDIIKKGIAKVFLNVPEWRKFDQFLFHNIVNSELNANKPRALFRQILEFLIQSRLNLNLNMSFDQDLGGFGNMYELGSCQNSSLNLLTRIASLDIRQTLEDFFANYKFIVIFTIYDRISKEPIFVSQCCWNSLNDEKVVVSHSGDYFGCVVQAFAIQF